MAAAKVEDEFLMMCCLGDHSVKNPRLLPCQHSVCIGCIKAEVEQERKMFICPKCQLSIPLTEKDVDQLPEDVLYHIMQETKTNNDCVLCKFEDRTSIGTFQCLDCADVLCDQCQKGHTRSSQTRLHRVLPMKDIPKQKDGIQVEKLLFCDTHSKPNKPMVLEYYCEDCKVLACSFCTFKEHQPQGHACSTVDEIHDEKMAAVADHVTKLLGVKKCMEDFASVLGEELLHNDKLKEKLDNIVHDRANTFIEMIENIKEKTLTTVKEHFRIENASIQTKLKETNSSIVRIDSNVSYAQAFLKHTTKTQFLQHQYALIRKLSNQNKQRMDTSLKSNTIEIEQIEFDKANEVLTEAFGKVNIRDRTIHGIGIGMTTQLMKEPKVLLLVNSGLDFIGDVSVTEKGDIVAVTKTHIVVYRSDGTLNERIHSNEFTYTNSVVARGNTLYVSNPSGGRSVSVIDFKGKVKKVVSTNDNLYQYRSLAVDNEGNIFVSHSTHSTIYKCAYNETKAKVFIKQGKHPDLKCPTFLCLTPGGELVVSNLHSHTVQVYDKLGEFMWQYKGQGDMKLSLPKGIFCDKNYNIYICDCDNNRIQVIQNNEFKGCIKTRDLKNPRCIDMDKDDNIFCGYDTNNIVKLKVWE